MVLQIIKSLIKLIGLIAVVYILLPLLVGLASQAIPFLTSTVLPALGVGALSGLASTGVQKLYIKKGGYVCEIETDGKDLVLEPITGKVFAKYGDGLYLKKDGKIYDGRGILLGPNSPFKHIPVIRMLL